MIQLSAISSENSNLTAGGMATAGASHPLAQGTNYAASDSTAEMSFDDFLDMVNPLQHIPVVSSIYRAVAGESINPVSRIAGDALYGGVLGLATAGLSALGAIGDEVMTAANGGKSTAATVLAALTGDDDATQDATSVTQLAENTAQTESPALIADTSVSTEIPQTEKTQTAGLLQTPARQSPILQMPDMTPTAPTQTAATAAEASPATETTTASADTPKSGMPLDRSKAPYGGVMDTAMMASAQQNQALALAMSGRNAVLQAQHNLRNSRFATALPAANAAVANAATTSKTDPTTQAAMQNLLQELNFKGTAQYKNAAQSTPIPGGTLNITN